MLGKRIVLTACIVFLAIAPPAMAGINEDIMTATERNDVTKLKILLNGAVSIFKGRPSAETLTLCLMYAAQRGNLDSIEVLMKAGADPYAIIEKYSPVHQVTQARKFSALKTMVLLAPPNPEGLGDALQVITAQYLLMEPHVEIARFLIESGADPNREYFFANVVRGSGHSHWKYRDEILTMIEAARKRGY